MNKIGKATKLALVAYVTKRQRPERGDFLEAVLCNDLRLAVLRADDVNIKALVSLMRWLYMYAPASCYGSTELFSKWLIDKSAPRLTCDMPEGIEKLEI